MISGDAVTATAGPLQVGITSTNGNWQVASTGQLLWTSSPTGAAATSSTQNAPCGSSTLSSGNQTYTLTNSFATANSQVFVQLVTNTAGVCNLLPVTAGGSIVFTSVIGTGAPTNTTANAKFNWWIVN
jgi:hypothetical protein